MKTLTEYKVVTLKAALQTRSELTQAGKTAEELPAALGEALKLEGDKLTLMIKAMDYFEKRSEGLKRIVVLQLAENEAPPKGAEMVETHCFLPEFFPNMQPKPGRGGRFGRDGRDDRGGRGKGRGDKKRGRGPRGDRSEGGRLEGRYVETPSGIGAGRPVTPEAGAGGREFSRRPKRGRGPRRDQTANATGAEGAAGSPRPARPPREKREPRPKYVHPTEPVGRPVFKASDIKPKGTAAAAAQASAPAASPSES